MLNGTRDPRRQAEVASSDTSSNAHAWRTISQTTEYGRSQCYTKCVADCLHKFLASKPKRPSVEIMNEEKELRTNGGQLRVLSIYRGHLFGLIEPQDREALRLGLIEQQELQEQDKEALRVVI